MSTREDTPRDSSVLSPLPPPPARRWHHLTLRIVLTVVLGYLLVSLNSRYFFHAELSEHGDSAANTLSVLRAERWQELYGAYSRWGFHHPGPALFYGEALGDEILYRWLHLTPAPYNAQMLVVIGLLVSFFAAGISVAARWVRGGTFLALALAAAAWHFTAVDGRFLLVSAWPPYVAPLILFCLLVSAASVAAGQGEDLPLLTLAGCFLLHLHAAQPLFVAPMFLLGYVGLCWSCWRRRSGQDAPAVSLAKAGDPAPPPSPPSTAAGSALPWRIYRRSHRFAGLIAVCFALPVLVDLLFPDGNFHRIRLHLQTYRGEHHALLASFEYFLRFAAYTPSLPTGDGTFSGAVTPQTLRHFLLHHPLMMLLWLGALLSPLLPLAVRVWRGKEPTLLGETAVSAALPTVYEAPAGRWRFLGWLYVTWLLSVGLTLFWGTIQDGAMFYYNAWFDYSIWYVLALFAAGALADALDAFTFRSERRLLWKAGVILLCAGLAGVTLARHPERFRADDADGEADRLQHRSVADRLSTEPAGTPRAKLLFFPHDAWQSATGIAVQLTRAGRPAYVSPEWETVFGPDHQVPDWKNVVSRPADTNPTFECWHLVSKQKVSGEDARFPLFMDYALVPGGLPIDPAVAPEIVWQGGGTNNLDYTSEGWEGTDTETTARLALLQFRPCPVPPTAGVRITFHFTVYPFARRPGPQRMEVRFNGNDLGTLSFARDAAGAQSVTVPAATWNRYGAVLLTLAFPDAVAPITTGEGSDRRPHAFDAHRISFALEAGATGSAPPPAAAVPPIPAPAPVPSPVPTPEATPFPSPPPATTIPPDQNPADAPTPTPEAPSGRDPGQD